MRHLLYTDGAARGNPGHSGACICIQDHQGTVLFEPATYLGKGTNKVPAYKALLLGLKAARGLHIKDIGIYADSQLMVFQIQGKYRVKNEYLKKLYNQAMDMLQAFNYEIMYISREKNKMADKLANQAIDRKLGG